MSRSLVSRDLRPWAAVAVPPMIESMEFDRNGLEILEREECLQLLAASALGRIAVSSQALPVILPVNFLLDGDRILIRTSPGSKLQAATTNAVVAFEVDQIDPFTHAGWSVSVTGVASEIPAADARDVLTNLPLAHWAPSPAEHVVAISTDLISGRRIREDHRAWSTP
jgi:nitroimidazol reductase NimA-like FMN-containing flavoprotein (pyridoxamine 5'-phosphate oxidase superfamily)